MSNAFALPDGSPGPNAGPDTSPSSRRTFLERLGRGGAAALGAGALGALAAGCKDGPTDPLARATIATGTPAGALNLVYAYAQFMADFYVRAAAGASGATNNFVGMTRLEYIALAAIGSHKNAQRNALANLIPSGRIPDLLLFDFSAVDFSSRAAVLGFAQRFEDLGVAAVNGLMPTLQNATDVTLVAKIAANWARHAAVVHDLIDVAAGNADTANRTGVAATVAAATGLDQTTDAATAVAAIQPYLRTRLELS